MSQICIYIFVRLNTFIFFFTKCSVWIKRSADLFIDFIYNISEYLFISETREAQLRTRSQPPPRAMVICKSSLTCPVVKIPSKIVSLQAPFLKENFWTSGRF